MNLSQDCNTPQNSDTVLMHHHSHQPSTIWNTQVWPLSFRHYTPKVKVTFYPGHIHLQTSYLPCGLMYTVTILVQYSESANYTTTSQLHSDIQCAKLIITCITHLNLLYLTLCRSYLKPYCMGRKTAFFQQAFTFTYYTRNKYPLQEKKIITIKVKKTEW